jgi:uncharacterized protein YndB with AHSA1/START domain
MTREIHAPRELVFEAHSSCEHISHWWGPRRYEISECDVDFRPGGAWRVVHRGSEGEEFVFHGEYREIVPPERITWTFEWEGMPGHVSVQTVEFAEHDGVTTLTSTAVFDSKEDRDGMLQSGAAEGAEESMQRLEEYLESLRARRAS